MVTPMVFKKSIWIHKICVFRRLMAMTEARLRSVTANSKASYQEPLDEVLALGRPVDLEVPSDPASMPTPKSNRGASAPDAD